MDIKVKNNEIQIMERGEVIGRLCFEEKEKIFRTEIQALADIDGISFEEALEKIESIFIDQYFQENDEKVAEQLQNAASGLMMMELLSE